MRRKVLEQSEPERIDISLFGAESQTIRSLSEALLLHIYRTDPADGRTVGLMYETVLGYVRGNFPKCRTKVSGLRWYAVHLREKGKRLPQKRPRPPLRRKYG